MAEARVVPVLVSTTSRPTLLPGAVDCTAETTCCASTPGSTRGGVVVVVVVCGGVVVADGLVLVVVGVAGCLTAANVVATGEDTLTATATTAVVASSPSVVGRRFIPGERHRSPIGP
ncbi:hypothetical protein GCM10010174_84030 [Kutzneria viridogrisea]